MFGLFCLSKRRASGLLLLLVAVLGLLSAATQLAMAQYTESVLYNFKGIPDGAYPYDGLVGDKKGNLYGTTNAGGEFNQGTVFVISKTGAEKVLYSFSGGADGAYPQGWLVLDKQGNLFGTTYFGGSYINCTYGCGIVFEVAPDGTETVLHRFGGGTDGAYPAAGLIRDKQGNFYGTTLGGGSPNCGCGTVFQLTPDSAETILYSFNGGVDGSTPVGGLVRDTNGNLYGTTPYGGTFNQGTVFEVSAAGVKKLLYGFSGGVDGGYPVGTLIRDRNGKFYGTTAFGGTDGKGTVFGLTGEGVETVLYSFQGGPEDGANPSGSLATDKQGNLYGTTSSGGTNMVDGIVFEVPPNGVETVLYKFQGGNDGAAPTTSLLRSRTGNFYGTTGVGGTNNFGTVFKLMP